MSEEQAEWAIQSLYENPNARDELTDADAETLLRWGEGQIMRLAEMNMDDAAFEEAYDQLSGLVRRMNRLAARRAQLPPEDVELGLNRIAEAATMVGLPVAPENLTTYLNQPVAQDASPNVQALIDLLMTGQQSDTTWNKPHDETQSPEQDQPFCP
jgi:hypothetical protein